MKKLLFGMMLTAAATTNIYAQTVLSGNITTSRRLSDKCYIISGCVTVQAPAVLTIDPGTVLYGDTAAASKGGLVIQRGAKIIADGFPSGALTPNPIIFTSLAAPGSRKPGDWGGIIIAGRASNNQAGDTFQVEGPCVPIIAGGTNCDDSSGVFRYVQIHYAGVSVGVNTGNEINSLTLAAVGRKTVIDHVQVTYANDDAFEWFGGCVNTKYLISYNTRDDDFDTDFGFSGLSQFGFALRRDTSMHDISGSNGIESDNMGTSPFLSPAGRPETSPIFSNYSLIGPKYCNNFTVNSEFKTGAHIRRNSNHSLYNSFVTGWPVNGVLIDGTTTQANTISGTGTLEFAYNSYANAVDAAATPLPWTGCGSISVNDWLFGGSCTAGNEQLASINGLSSTLCNLACSQTRPSFTLNTGTTNMDAPDYTSSALSSSFFDATPNYRGAFGGTDWTLSWTEWCPQNATYTCTSPLVGGEVIGGGLNFVPNPSNSTTAAVFESNVTGKATITILDKVTGQPVRVVTAEIVKAGTQSLAFSVAGLSVGTYTVKVQTAEGVKAAQIMVK